MRCFVTGSSGQCGSYVCEHLLEEGHEVFGMVRRNTSFVPEKSFLSDCIHSSRFHLVKGDVTDPYSLERLMDEIHPQWFFNAAAQSHVGESWDYPIHTVDATAKGVLHCLEVIRKTTPSCKFLQFSSSELFGMVRETPQNELTPFYPPISLRSFQALRLLDDGQLSGVLRSVLHQCHSLQHGIAAARV